MADNSGNQNYSESVFDSYGENGKQEQLQKKNNMKQSAFMVCIGILVVTAVVFVFLMFFYEKDDSSAEPTDPYASLYSYLNGFTSSEDGVQNPTIPDISAETTFLHNSAVSSLLSAVSPSETQSPGGSAIPSAGASVSESNVSGDVSLPKPNGKMYVDVSSDNKFIKIVNKAYGIDVKLLSAVFALPDTGQNYVLEWNGKTDGGGKILRNADTLRRCYLIDKNGKVTAIAAVDQSERMNMSRAENKLAMETLIKKVILPEIENQLN